MGEEDGGEGRLVRKPGRMGWQPALQPPLQINAQKVRNTANNASWHSPRLTNTCRGRVERGSMETVQAGGARCKGCLRERSRSPAMQA